MLSKLKSHPAREGAGLDLARGIMEPAPAGVELRWRVLLEEIPEGLERGRKHLSMAWDNCLSLGISVYI